jgi:hypothetical protein
MLLICLFSHSSYVYSTPGCNIYMKSDQNQVVSCFQFKSWPELCKLLSQKNLTGVISFYFFPAPSSSLILTSQVLDQIGLNFYEIVDMTVNFYRLRGISILNELETNQANQGTNKTIYLNVFNIDFHIQLFQSEIEFFIGNKPQSELACTRDIILQKETTIFSKLSYNVTSILFGNHIKYDTKPICPFIFAYTQLVEIDIINQVDSFLFKNLLRFQIVEESLSINSTVGAFYIDGYKYVIDETHRLVFENIKEIDIQGSVGSMQADLFKSFIHLSLVCIRPTSLINFLHQFGIEWTRYLQADSQVRFIEIFLNVWLFSKVYDYPDEDFCLFANWPHNKLILPTFDTIQVVNCSSTFTWLIQSYPLIKNTTKYHDDFDVLSFCNKCNSSLSNLNLTNFAKKLDICNRTAKSSITYFHLTSTI